MGFFLIAISILGSSSYLVWRGLLLPAATLAPFLIPMHAVLYGFAFLSLLVVISGRIFSPKRSASPIRLWSHTYFFCFLGLHGLLFTSLFLLWVVVIPFGAPLAMSAIAAFLGAYLLIPIGIFMAQIGPRMERIRIGEGDIRLKIAQISDLHIGATISEGYVKNVVTKTLAENADCIVLTGDIGDGLVTKHQGALHELARLDAPLGVFVILGNHECYWPTETWVEAFRKAGFHLLRDASQEISFQGKSFCLLGLEPMKGKAIEQLVPVKQKNLIVLSHYPNRADEAAKNQASLFLCGHTHGGQFWPFSWMIYLFHRYAKGRYQVGETPVYVHRGSGFWGPPLRFGARAEIAILDLALK